MALSAPAVGAEPAVPAKIGFNRDVRPILSEACFHCHGPDAKARAAKLRLDIREEALKAAESGKTPIVPGQPEKSEVVRRLLTNDEDDVMPPPKAHKALTAQQKAILKRWIAEGASFEAHWTFVPPVKAPVPQVPGYAIRNPVDAFVAEKLVKIGLPFSPEADKATLIRRLYFDLTGLPPKPEEVDAFVADASPDAYEKLVDRLMASRHYGERLALPWLDAARYADSNGFQQDGDTHQYVWRDWVVDALNDDMPFDQFSIEQLAGDLLPIPTDDQLIASAFNRNHLLNGEGGAIPEEQRCVNLFDRVDTTATNWLGLTMACAQCHDHKYDPLTMRDYYSMMALFNNVPETGVPSGSGQYRVAEPSIRAAQGGQKLKIQELKRALEQAREEAKASTESTESNEAITMLEAELASAPAVLWTHLLPTSASATDGVKLSMDRNTIFAEGPRPDKANYIITLANTSAVITGIRIKTLPDDRHPAKGAGRSDNGNAVLTKLRLSVGGREQKFAAAYAGYSQQGYSANGVIDEDPKTAWAFHPDVTKPIQLILELAEPLALERDASPVLTLEFQSEHKQHQLGGFAMTYTSAPHPVKIMQMPAEIAALLKNKDRTADESKKVRDYLMDTYPPAARTAAQAKVTAAEKAFNDFQSSLPRVMIMSDKQPRKTHVLDRGEYLKPKEEVAAGVPAFLPPLPEEAPKNRLGFAQWLFRPEHPLTARVQVNRIWQYFFGIGLVKTSEDLGVQSQVPVHGELLDWLALEFRDQAWSQKTLNRLILTSTTYRQSSRFRPEHWQRDPENQFLSRAARFRLPSMILRDLALSASGLLNDKAGGKPVYPYQPPDVWEGLAITKERDFTYPASSGSDLYRRSLYTFWRRTVSPVNMFDASPRQTCKVRPENTSTPLHALTTLNDPTWTEASRVLAEKAIKSSSTPVSRITWAFRRILARAPSEGDLSLLTRAYEKQLAACTADPNAAAEFLAVGLAPRDQSLACAEHAAMTAVCLALFNIDESLTRQ
ncbi:MAG: PSD1 and planctomycete cytochrome C domain-containing protein [Verrucomicrobiales bacterium]